MKNIFAISESEKSRIIDLHESATKRFYLKEQYEDIKQGGPGDPYQYAKKDGKYFYAKKGTENWIEQKNQRGIDAIKSTIYGEKVQQSSQPEAGKPKPKPEAGKPKTGAGKPKPEAGKPKPEAGKPKPVESQKQFCPTINQNSKQIVDINNIYNYYKKQLNLPSYSQGSIWTHINGLIDKKAKTYFNTIKNDRISCEIALNCVRPLIRNFNLIVVDTLNQFIYLFDPNGTFIAKDVIISGKNKQSVDPAVAAKAMLTWE